MIIGHLGTAATGVIRHVVVGTRDRETDPIVRLVVEHLGQVQDQRIWCDIACRGEVQVQAEASCATQVQLANGCSALEGQVFEQSLVVQDAQHVGQDDLAFGDVQIHPGIGRIPLDEAFLDHHHTSTSANSSRRGTLSTMRQVGS